MIIRKAHMSDAGMLYQWRNDDLTRAASHDSSVVDYENHVKWLKKSLSNKSRFLLIAEVDGVPVGTARVDMENESRAELSWTIAPEHRGNGLSKIMMKIVFDEFKGRHLLRAEIKDKNTPSIKVALFLGMVEIDNKDGIVYFQSSTW